MRLGWLLVLRRQAMVWLRAIQIVNFKPDACSVANDFDYIFFVLLLHVRQTLDIHVKIYQVGCQVIRVDDVNLQVDAETNGGRCNNCFPRC